MTWRSFVTRQHAGANLGLFLLLAATLLILTTAPIAAQPEATTEGADDAAAEAIDAPAVPERTYSGLELEVQEALLDEGMVYHVMTEGDTQVTVTSQAAFQRVRLSSGAAVGYAVAPFDLDLGEGIETPFLGAAIRLPAASLRSGVALLDSTVAGESYLNVAEHPEITFVLTEIQSSELLESEDPDAQRFRLELAGSLTLRGISRPIVVPTEATFHLASGRTMQRYVGDFLRLEASFELDLEEFGHEVPRGGFGQMTLASTLEVDLFLVLNTVPPEKVLDPSIDHRRWLAEQRYLVLARDLADAEAAAQHGRAHLTAFSGDPDATSSLARLILDTPGLAERDYALALDAAKASGDSSDSQALLARAHAARGDVQAAVEAQKRALANAEDLSEEVRDALSEALEGYEKAAQR